jgi:hypothetical protein
MEAMKIIGIAALSLMLAASFGPAKADPWKDESGNGRGWREHSQHWDRDRGEHHSRHWDRDRHDRHSWHWGWDRDRRDGRGDRHRDNEGYGSSYRPFGNGGPFHGYWGR